MGTAKQTVGALQTKRRALVKALAGAACIAATEAWAEDTAAPIGGTWKGPVANGSGWLEWRLDAASELRRPRNPYDPAEVDLRVRFTAPDGRVVLATAFWTQDRDGTGWAVRLLPHVAGNWQADTSARLAGGAARALGAAFSFAVTKVPTRARIGVHPKHRDYFAYEDGEPYVPVGLNLGWSTGNVVDDYRRWFARLSEQGGNFARLWMSSWAFGLEWSDTGLGNYGARLDRAAQLDQVLQLAEQYGIRVMLCFINHGAFSEKLNAEWAQNPYNAARGGPNAKPEQFVTDPRSRALFARRVRYIAARWSHSPALHSWEWWNEVNWTPIGEDALAPWIREMSAVLAQHDPYGRLRTTSGHEAGSKIWSLPEIDFMQDHAYTQDDLSIFLRGRYRAFREAVPDKPLLMAELGNETDAPDTRRPYNWDDVHLHNGLWAALLSGFAGTGMYWWWDLLVDRLDMWPAFRGVSAFVAAAAKRGAPLAAHRPVDAAVGGGEASALALAAPHSVLIWVRADMQDVTSLKQAFLDLSFEEQAKPTWQPDWPKLASVGVRVGGIQKGARVTAITWLDTRTGQPLAGPFSGSVSATGELSIACPPFDRDIAAIVTLTT
jgi:hypothetical protein